MGFNIDLSPGKDFIESLMQDACIIVRDAQQVADDTLDVVTGLLVRPTLDFTTVYNGPCLFKRPPPSAPSEVGGEPLSQIDYRILLPVAVTDVRMRDQVTCIGAANDQYILGRNFRVLGVSGGSFSTYRSLYVQDITTGQVAE